MRDMTEVLWRESTWRKVLVYPEQQKKIHIEKFWPLLNFCDLVWDIIAVNLVKVSI